MSGASSSERDLDAKPGDVGQAPTVDAGRAGVTPVEEPASFVVLPGADGERRADVERSLKPGDTLGRFVVRSELGRGGMGVVYAADDVKLGREVALKVLPSDDEEPRRRFLREARAAAVLSDPGIATVYDVGEDAGRVFIAMELVRGRTLRAVLDARPATDRALSPAEALRLGREVARALAAAHARGVVHRDLKPENVMITDGGQVKILDFGLAKRSDPSLETGVGTASTDAGRILGTPSYMSPEQAKGRPVDLRSDVFSLGVMLYELVTGVRPFDRPTVVEMFVAIDRDEPAPPSRARPRLPAAIERVVLRCLRKEPAARYADAREVLRELELITVTAPALLSRARALALAAVVAIGGLVAFAAMRRPATKPGGAVWEATSTAVVPTALTALPMPQQGKPEAIAAYREGFLAFRAGELWDEGFLRAAEMDPSIAMAHLRVATMAMAQVMPAAREHFRKADELQSTLSERDRALLHAIEPVVRRQPADWAEANKRLAALLERYPGDAELWYYLACGTANYADFDAGARYYARAAEIDPGFARAYAGMAMDLAYLGRYDEARAAVARCLSVSPVSHGCLSLQELIQSVGGDCEGGEATARRIIAAGGRPAGGYKQLAYALAARGQPISTVREALRQAEVALEGKPDVKPERRARMAAHDALLLGLLSGDFEAAEKAVRTYEKLVGDSREQDEHGGVAVTLASVLEEEGRDKEAADVAIEFLDRRDAWEPNPGAEDVAMARDATPTLLVIALAGGKLTRADYVARRSASLRSWTGRVTPVSKNFLWLHSWARAVGDAEGAREAIAALPEFPPPPPFRPETSIDMDVGRAYLLAGRPTEAIAWLEPYTRSCTFAEDPIAHTRAFHLLGRAREEKGDVKGACAAYQVVLDRWGKAKPRSVTADGARDRVKALRCGP